MATKNLKFTFRRDELETGLAAVGQQRGSTIKLRGVDIGSIHHPNRWTGEKKWRISFRVAR